MGSFAKHYEILENSAPALMFHQLQFSASVQMDGAQMATSSVEFVSALAHMLLRRKNDAELALKLGQWCHMETQTFSSASD